MNARASAGLVVVLFLCCLMTSSCGDSQAPQSTILVFAAASLSESFQKLASEYESLHPGKTIELHFAGTPTLVLQVTEGAPAAIFASADERNMERLARAGLLKSAAIIFAENELVIITAKNNPKKIEGLSDLSAPELSVLLCGEEVPAGRYARQALKKAGIQVHSRSDESSVQSIMTKVELGEADAGIVYLTDSQAAIGRIAAVTIPDEFNVRARYPIATLKAAAADGPAESFVAFIQSNSAREILSSFGFMTP